MLTCSPGWWIRTTYPDDWRTPALVEPNQPVLPIAFRLDGVTLSFVTAMTQFSAPQNLTLDELQVESWFPADADTRRLCEQLAQPAAQD